MDSQNENKLDIEQIREYIDKTLDKRFESIRTQNQRVTWENNAVDKIISIAQGSAPNPHKSTLIKLFSNLNDPTLPSFFRKVHAKETAWLDRDFFRRTPDGIESTDTDGAYWITDFQKDNLNNELSNFHPVARAVIYQVNAINLGALKYRWICVPKKKIVHDIDNIGGRQIIRGKREEYLPLEFEIQGIEYQFINALNIYPDILNETTFESHGKLDLYSKAYLTLQEIQDDPRYNVQIPYEWEGYTLYRGLEGIEQLDKNMQVEYSQAETRLNKGLNSGATDTDGARAKNKYEVRYATVKEIRINGKTLNAEGNGYTIEYVKQGTLFIPLLVEENHFNINKKTTRIFRKIADPSLFYCDSEIGMMINQHNYIVHNKQLQASAIARAVNPSRMWSAKILKALGVTIEELKKFVTQSGEMKLVNLEELFDSNSGSIDAHLRPFDLGEVDKNLRDLEVLQKAIDGAKMDISNANVQVTDQTGAGATAAYNKQIAVEQDLLAKEFKSAFSREIIEPSLDYALEMAKIVFNDMKFTTAISSEDKKYLLKEANKGQEQKEEKWEDIQEAAKEYGPTIGKKVRIGQQEQVVSLNPLTEKKQMILSKALFEYTPTAYKFEIEDSEYSKSMVLEETTQLFGNIIANIPDSPLKYLMTKLSVEKILQITNDSNYAEIKEELEKTFQDMINPPPPPPNPVEEQALMLEGQQRQANIEKTASETEKNYAEVQNKKVDNAYKVAGVI